VRILKSPEVVQTLAANGLEVIANTPSDFEAIVRRDGKLWEEAAEAAGLVLSQ
jgi:tripartite-type tricarboxylate transporter receptor subunit TctC